MDPIMGTSSQELILYRALLSGLAVAVAFCQAAQAQTATQFDLICVGTAKDSKGGQTLSERAFSKRFRVDLTVEMWCEETCSEVVPIASVTPGKLGLYDYNSRFVEHFINVNRQTGSYHEYEVGKSSWQSTVHDGKCEPAAFTGFPAKRF